MDPASSIIRDRVQGCLACAIVADPKRAGRTEGHAPGVHQVRILQDRNPRQIGNQVELPVMIIRSRGPRHPSQREYCCRYEPDGPTGCSRNNDGPLFTSVVSHTELLFYFDEFVTSGVLLAVSRELRRPAVQSSSEPIMRPAQRAKQKPHLL